VEEIERRVEELDKRLSEELDIVPPRMKGPTRARRQRAIAVGGDNCDFRASNSQTYINTSCFKDGTVHVPTADLPSLIISQNQDDPGDFYDGPMEMPSPYDVIQPYSSPSPPSSSPPSAIIIIKVAEVPLPFPFPIIIAKFSSKGPPPVYWLQFYREKSIHSCDTSGRTCDTSASAFK